MAHHQKSATSSSKLLGISKTRVASKKCSPNILPCRIHHDGPVNASRRYWSTVEEENHTKTAYFRGRKLRGRTINIPHGYEGLLLKTTDRVIRPSQPDEDTQEGDEEVDGDTIEECTAMEAVASFDDITVWSHEVVPDDLDNPYFKGIEELIAFAGAIHSYDSILDTTSGHE